MSISASMNAGVLGLAANSTRLSTIADNLANAGTVGYKRAEVQFSSLVASQSSLRQYWAGGVVPSVRHAINERGVLQATSVSTDFAVNGRGFLPVVNTTTPGAVDPQQDEFLLTTAGSFRADANGFLRNSAGLYLQGWRSIRTARPPRPIPRATASRASRRSTSRASTSSPAPPRRSASPATCRRRRPRRAAAASP